MLTNECSNLLTVAICDYVTYQKANIVTQYRQCFFNGFYSISMILTQQQTAVWPWFMLAMLSSSWSVQIKTWS